MGRDADYSSKPREARLPCRKSRLTRYCVPLMPSALSARDDPPAAEPRQAFLIAAFLGIAILLTFPHVTGLGTFIAGDSGDSLLNLWILRTVQAGLPHGWRALWSPPIFFPHAMFSRQRHAASRRDPPLATADRRRRALALNAIAWPRGYSPRGAHAGSRCASREHGARRLSPRWPTRTPPFVSFTTSTFSSSSAVRSCRRRYWPRCGASRRRRPSEDSCLDWRSPHSR